MKFKKRLFFIILPALFLFLAGAYCFIHIDGIRFDRIAGDFFEDSLKNDALTLHYTLAEPENYGIRCENVSLPVYSRDAALASGQATTLFLQKLETIRPEKLSDADRYTYELLSSYLKQELEGNAFSYYEEPLSPSSGMHTELPLLLAEYRFRDKDDVTDYLALLASVPACLEGLAAYEKEKAEAGLFMPNEDALNVAAQCRQILSETLLAEGTHFLQSTFSSRLEELLEAGLISQQEQTQFLAENQRLLTTVAAPAYQKLAESITALTEKSTSPGGLCQLPEGKAYYAWLVRHTTGCGMDPDALSVLLQKQFRKTYTHLQETVSAYRQLTGSSPDMAALTEDFPLSDPAEILTDLQRRMAGDFPGLDALLGAGGEASGSKMQAGDDGLDAETAAQQTPASALQIQCTIKDVDPSLESFTSPAYYMTPPVDDLLHNTICINRASTAGGVELYTTLAHEGYPGHLYQTVYSSLAAASADSSDTTPVRELLYYGGYTEGWAYYAERLSYEYAAQALGGETAEAADPATADSDTADSDKTAEAADPATADSDTADSDKTPTAATTAVGTQAALLCEIAAAQRDLQVNLFCLLDISLHYQGATEADLQKTLAGFGLEGASAERICDYIRTSPAVYLKYYVGYLEMLALRAKARQLWGDDFSLLRFHTFILETGPSDFDSLFQQLEYKTSCRNKRQLVFILPSCFPYSPGPRAGSSASSPRTRRVR